MFTYHVVYIIAPSKNSIKVNQTNIKKKKPNIPKSCQMVIMGGFLFFVFICKKK